jgi:hypothetical protein
VDAGGNGNGSSSGSSSGGGSSGSGSSSGGGSSSSGSGSSSGGSGSSSGGSGSSSGGGGDGSASGAPVIPSPTGTCPTIANGEVTFAPAGIAPRKVTLNMGSAPAHGPLIFYWHATGSSPLEATYSLGTTMSAITAAGGVVAAPSPDPNAGQFEWYLVSGTKTDDLLVADEVVGCLAKAGIDTMHIHSMGMSAGALQTTAMSYLRSSYLASVTTYSGGLAPGVTWPAQDASNKFAAFLFYGGANDNAYGFDFQAATKLYQSTLKGAGHFAPICNHNKGHMIPTDAAPSVWAFFQANGFGVSPSPYAGGLPSTFPSYCSL